MTSTSEVVNLERILDSIEHNTRNGWTTFLNLNWTPSERITDYAQPLVSIISTYDPSLFSSTLNQQIQRYLRNVIYAKLASESFVVKRHVTSNWHPLRLWVMAEIVIVLKWSSELSRLRQELLRFLTITLNTTTGAFTDFAFRDSVQYHAYCLDAVLKTAVTLAPAQYTIAFDPTTGTLDLRILWTEWPVTQWLTRIQPAFRFLYPYVESQKTHIEFRNSQLTSDTQRNDYGDAFQPSSVRYVFQTATVGIPSFHIFWDSCR